MRQTFGSHDVNEKSKLNPSTQAVPDQKFFNIKNKVTKALTNYSEEINKQINLILDSAAKVYLINRIGSIAIIYKFLCSLELYTDDEFFYLFPEIKGEMEKIIKEGDKKNVK
jgi:hypothetical protein